MEEKKYIFSCGHKNGEHHCNGIHEFEINDELVDNMVFVMIYRYNLKVDKQLIFKTINNLYNFIEDKHKENQIDNPIFEHWSKIDINTELLIQFTDKEFGKPLNE